MTETSGSMGEQVLHVPLDAHVWDREGRCHRLGELLVRPTLMILLRHLN